jgi:hypothetical protein
VLDTRQSRYISIVKKILNKFRVSTNYDRLTTSQNRWSWSEIRPDCVAFTGNSRNRRQRIRATGRPPFADSLFIDEKMDIITSLYGSHKNLLNDILTNVRRDFGLFEVVERTMVRYF